MRVHTGNKIWLVETILGENRIAKHLGGSAVITKLMFVNFYHSFNRTQPSKYRQVFWDVDLLQFNQKLQLEREHYRYVAALL